MYETKEWFYMCSVNKKHDISTITARTCIQLGLNQLKRKVLDTAPEIVLTQRQLHVV